MIRILFCCFAVWLSSSCFADEIISCELNALYTRISLAWSKERVTVRVQNPRGFSSMPQLEAPIPEEALGLLTQQSEELRSLGADFTFSWPISACERSVTNPWLLACRGPAVEQGGKIKVLARSLTTALISEDSLSGGQQILRFRFILSNQSMYFVAVPFPLSFCALRSKLQVH